MVFIGTARANEELTKDTLDNLHKEAEITNTQTHEHSSDEQTLEHETSFESERAVHASESLEVEDEFSVDPTETLEEAGIIHAHLKSIGDSPSEQETSHEEVSDEPASDEEEEELLLLDEDVELVLPDDERYHTLRHAMKIDQEMFEFDLATGDLKLVAEGVDADGLQIDNDMIKRVCEFVFRLCILLCGLSIHIVNFR